ncbi:molybdopterin-dependent oxidoreductase [Chloroflexota bacterium]
MIPRDHSYPACLVVRGGYGSKWVKWVVKIEVE